MALRLCPDPAACAVEHVNLGVALAGKGDVEGEIAEERAAVRLNPDLALAHLNLGMALGANGDWDGEIAEEREVLRLSPEGCRGACQPSGVALGGKR